MTLSYDPIPLLQSVGYTEREAAFLYLAALHSGYFLRRQYLRFIERGRGALAAQFLRRAFALGHIQSIACGQARFVYHLTSTEVYSSVRLGASHHRRLKSDATIKSRLMVLDFVLDHLDTRLLDTPQSKINHFTGNCSIDISMLPSSRGASFAEEFPILVKEVPCFTFFDEGALSSSSFEKFLSRYEVLLTKLPRFELLYVADSTHNFERARQVFAAKFLREQAPNPTSLTPRGSSHFLEYLRLRDRAATSNSPLTLGDLALLREGEELYARPEHQAILAAGPVNIERIRQRLERQDQGSRFLTAILPYNYPLHRFKFEREAKQELGSSEGSIRESFLKRKTMQQQLFEKESE